jgi:hypothetical protein
LTILAKTSFWALCYHYFGAKALLYVVASWTFLLGVKDITFVRVRLASLRNPAKRNDGYVKSVGAELALIVIRLAAILLLGKIIAPFNREVASVVPIMAVVAGFWARETIITISAAFGSGKLRLYVSFLASVAALGFIIYFAERGYDPIHSAIWSLLIREALSFFGSAIVAILGCLGVRSSGPADEDDDEDGGDAVTVYAPDGREIRSTWKLLIADNVVYSRWRMMHFATRFVAHGILGPFGGIATRIAFSYRKPKPYEHHQQPISAGKIALFGTGAVVMVGAIVYFGVKWGLLHAIGITAAAFILRVVALTVNLLFWRQLSPIVGTPKNRGRKVAE